MATKREQEQRRRTLRPHRARDTIADAMRTYDEPISPTRLAEITGLSLGSVAYHVRTLRDAGVVTLACEARVRGAVEHFYALVADNDADLNDPMVELQKLCGFLTVPGPNGYPTPLTLDEQARSEMQRMLDMLRPRVAKIIAAAAKREGAGRRSRAEAPALNRPR
ncbi:MAG TPA: winged helix-turn-helix domain-containing protein [Baekduia sp.]|nr:winged helix-turn-helix domain-containing protein [Baekduia sp.]